MNGAAMNCRQEPSLGQKHRDSRSVQNPGYYLQTNHQQNLQQQHSKILNYQSLPASYSVDGYDSNLNQSDSILDSRHSFRENENLRLRRPKPVERRNEPMDLPVPQFVLDEHSVTYRLNKTTLSNEESKALDLDTRIGMLLKSKALAGMHPIFSDLNDSEESDSDLDDPLLSRPRYKVRKTSRNMLIGRDMESPVHESFDDPEKPLSRPPSPFLSRASYLFWFNKAIEIKQQAKAQEQALLEQATKRLIQESMKKSQPNVDSQKIPELVPKTLMDEISKEFKELIKQEFMRQVIEQTALNAFDDWWDSQNEEKNTSDLHSFTTASAVNSDNDQEMLNDNQVPRGSTSPKMRHRWNRDTEEENSDEPFCQNEMPKHKALSANHEVNFNLTLSAPTNQENLARSVPLEDQDTLTKDSSGEIGRNKCDRFPEAGIRMSLTQLDSAIANTERSVSENSLKQESLKTDNSLKDFENCSIDKIGDKFLIVKDILDLVFNNVNKIIAQRDKVLHKE